MLDDLNDSGVKAYPNIFPFLFISTNGLTAKKGRIIPLGGISNITTILGNESGYWPIIETDEHGFNNPKGLFKNFRVDITAYMFSKLRRGQKVDWKSYAPLKEAIESKLTSSVKQISRIVTKSKSRDKKQQGKYNEMVKTLIKDYGYNENSAEEVIKFAANNLWRDS